MDQHLIEAGQFLQLPVPDRVTVIACGEWSDFYRFMPHFIGWRGYGMALHLLDTIYLTPLAREVGFDEEEAVRHELSHAVLNQNSTFRAALRIRRQQWIAEGLAVWFQGGRRFLSEEEFFLVARRRDLLRIIPPALDSPAQREQLPFRYAAWHFFLRHIVQRHGRETFQRFLLAYLADPDSYREIFAREYGHTIEAAAVEFQEAVRRGQP